MFIPFVCVNNWACASAFLVRFSFQHSVNTKYKVYINMCFRIMLQLSNIVDCALILSPTVLLLSDDLSRTFDNVEWHSPVCLAT